MGTKTSDRCRWNKRASARITLIRSILAVGLLPGTVVTASGSALPKTILESFLASEIVTFSVTGDVPYGSSQVSLFQDQIDEHDLYSPSEFLVHVGDILAGNESCNETRYQNVRDILHSSEVPCYIVPGDNETSDCSNPTQGLQFWYQYLLAIDDSWTCSPVTDRQGGRQENFAFVHKEMLFLGIHLVGGSNSNSVLQDDADWVDAKLQLHGSAVRGAVIFAQSGPGTSASTFYDSFEISASNFGKPILYMQGNGHSWKDDTPFNASNVRRIQVNSGGDELPVQITVGLDASNPQTMFSYVRNPWDSGSNPVNRPPCGDPTPNEAPVASNDAYNVDEDVVLDIPVPGVLGNDTDADNDPLSAVLVSAPLDGTLSLGSNGSFSYVPDADFNGLDSFVYTADDGRNGTDTATVTITVNPQDDAPVASNDNWNTAVSTTLEVGPPGVLGNDIDVDGDNLTALLLVGTTNGNVNLAADGSFTYTPDPGYNGPDTFTYEASDGNTTSQASVALTVGEPVVVVFLPTDDAHVRTGSSNNYGSATTLRVRSSSSSYHTYLKFQVTGFSSAQTATLRLYVTDNSPHGGFVHTVSNDYAGTGTPWDESGLNANNAPSIFGTPLDDAGSVTAGGWIELDVTAAVNGDGVYSFGIQSNSTNSVFYSSKEGGFPPELVVERDSGGGDPGNTAPVAVDDTGSTNEDTQLIVVAPGLLGNDSDVDEDSLMASLGVAPANGAVTLSSDGSYVYTPNPNFHGADVFSYTVADGRGGSDTGNVSIDVVAVNDAPAAFADAWSVSKNEILIVSAPGVLTNDTDPDGDPLTAVLGIVTSNGVLDLASDGSFTYTPGPDYVGNDSFTYRARDDSLQSVETTVALTITDGAPTTITLSPLADARVYSGNPTSNYGDRDPLRARADATSYESYLKFEIIDTGFVQQATLRMYCVDGSPDGGAIHAVSNDYAGTSTPWEESGIVWDNAPPVVTPALDAPGSVQTGTWVEFDLSSAISGNGIYSFCLKSGSSNSVRYTSREGTDPPELVLQTQGSGSGNNTPPDALAESYTLDEDQVLNVAVPGVLGNDTDTDGDPLSVTLESAPANGQLQLLGDGSFSYTPSSDFNGADSFTYRVHDGRGGTDTALVDLVVAPVNDAPTGVSESYSVAPGGVLNVATPGVLANDTDIDDDTMSVVLETDVANGAMNLNADGSFTYAPDAAFEGTDSFAYRATDANLQSDPITVTIAVGSAPPANLAFEEVQSGGSSGSTQVSTSSPLAGGADDLYLAAISSKPHRNVVSVTGLGLGWSRVRTQCSGRNQTGVEVWMARGPSSGGTVDALYDAVPNNAVLSVTRYSGADAATPIADVVSANTNGLSGTCSGGTDSPSYSVSVSVASDGIVFAAAAMRNRSHTSGPGYVERDEPHQGSSGGQQASVAVMDRDAALGSILVDGSFGKNVDWAMIAVVIRPQSAPVKPSGSSPTETEIALDGLPLYRVFPNPGFSSVSVAYELSLPTRLAVTIYNARGQHVQTLARGLGTPGRALVHWDTRDARGARVPAGVYFIRFEMGTQTLARKIVIQR